MNVEFTHLPALAEPVLTQLAPHAGEIFLDGTVGLGGHSSLIAPLLGAAGHLIGLDRDVSALALAQEKLRTAACRVNLIHSPFSAMRAALQTLQISQIDKILLDLGVSSMQLDNAERGFSFRHAAPLDMRMDTTQKLTAAEIVNQWSETELAEIFFRYGEERQSRRIARQITEIRRVQPINTTEELANLIAEISPRTYRGKIHPATRVFQALRIAVNDELNELEHGLAAAFSLLRPGGRLTVISFHSLEDRIVKRYFRALADNCEQPLAVLPHRKSIAADAVEMTVNRRARSAKLRTLEKSKA